MSVRRLVLYVNGNELIVWKFDDCGLCVTEQKLEAHVVELLL